MQTDKDSRRLSVPKKVGMLKSSINETGHTFLSESCFHIDQTSTWRRDNFFCFHCSETTQRLNSQGRSRPQAAADTASGRSQHMGATSQRDVLFFKPNQKAGIGLLMPRTDTMLHIYRNNTRSLLTDSQSMNLTLRWV